MSRRIGGHVGGCGHWIDTGKQGHSACPKCADDRAFEALIVAAMRGVDIPADEDKDAEEVQP